LGKTRYDTFDDMLTKSAFFKKNDKPLTVKTRVTGEPQTCVLNNIASKQLSN